MITRDKFKRFESVRRSGVTNMLDVARVSRLSWLHKAELIEIIKNYDRYKKEFGS